LGGESALKERTHDTLKSNLNKIFKVVPSLLEDPIETALHRGFESIKEGYCGPVFASSEPLEDGVIRRATATGRARRLVHLGGFGIQRHVK
jgi:hypothetical protein